DRAGGPARPMLALEDVRVAYGNVEVLRGVSLRVAAGELVCLIGANGAGKTTTAKTISGLLRPRGGRVTFLRARLDGRPAPAIARALMSNPKLLVLDEPSLGLSPTMVEATFQLITEIRRQGVTVLMVEQNAYLALRMADRGYVMETGRMVLEGAARTLLENEH